MLVYTLEDESKLCSSTARSSTDAPCARARGSPCPVHCNAEVSAFTSLSEGRSGPFGPFGLHARTVGQQLQLMRPKALGETLDELMAQEAIKVPERRNGASGVRVARPGEERRSGIDRQLLAPHWSRRMRPPYIFSRMGKADNRLQRSSL